MDNTKPTTSIITLRMYVDLLQRISLGEIVGVKELKGAEQRATKELINSGLASDGITHILGGRIAFLGHIAITPEGIAALESWSAHLRDTNRWSKFGDALIRFLWVMVGALSASMSDIFKAAFT